MPGLCGYRGPHWRFIALAASAGYGAPKAGPVPHGQCPLRSRILPGPFPGGGGGGRSANSPIPVDSIAHPDQFSCSLFRKPQCLDLSDRGFSCEDAHTCWRFLVRRGSQQRTKAGEGRIPDQCPSCHTQSPGPALTALARQPFQRFHCPEVEGVGRCTFPGLPLLL